MTLLCTNCDNDCFVDVLDGEVWCWVCYSAVKTDDQGTFDLRRMMLKKDYDSDSA